MAELFEHIPVLGAEVLEFLTFPADRPARLIDGTLGGGGHSAMLLRRYPQLALLGIDRDEAALAKAAETLAFASGRTRFVPRQLFGAGGDRRRERLEESRRHPARHRRLIAADRPPGTRFLVEGGGAARHADGPPLGTHGPACLLNTAAERELERIFREYGEVAKSRKLAAAVVRARQEKPFAVTSDLVALCDGVLGRSRPGQLPAPTLVFQALRIAVNDELGELERVLPAATELLNREGRLAVISFHSLEDRIVKNFFRDEAASCSCPPGLPVCICGKIPALRVVTRKAVTAGPEELEKNRRSAPAKLRVAEKII